MLINIVVLSSSESIRNAVRERQDAIIPESSRNLPYYKERGARFGLFGFLPSQDMKHGSFDAFLVELPLSDGLIVVSEKDLAGMTSHISNAIFVQTYEIVGDAVNTQNILAKPLARCLRDFAALGRLFDNMKQRKLILLPLRNFASAEIDQLVDLFSIGNQRDRFGEKLERIVSTLRARQTPKQPKTRSDVYYCDDKTRFFSYGPERHSLPDTSVPPHHIACILATNFRFGRLYDRELHFNVSVQPDGASIQGSFKGCHNDEQSVTATTHINMFPNDFMTWSKR